MAGGRNGFHEIRERRPRKGSPPKARGLPPPDNWIVLTVAATYARVNRPQTQHSAGSTIQAI